MLGGLEEGSRNQRVGLGEAGEVTIMQDFFVGVIGSS